jgi:hypothetical protein
MSNVSGGRTRGTIPSYTRRAARVIGLFGLALALHGCATLPQQFERELAAGRSVEGEIHGAHPDLDLYVFTYRSPDSFFEFIEVSLLATSPELATELAELRRHDRVRIAGTLADNRSNQPHVELASLEVVRKYEASPPIRAYEHRASLPDDLLGTDTGLFLVHAVHAGGTVLVVEHEDAVLPVYVRRPELTRGLARNDVVRLHYEIRDRPERPVHLQLKDVAQPVEVVDSVMALHGKPASIEGALVLFPQSPQVRFNVFAVLQSLPGGLQRQFTLVNFDGDDVFAAIRAKAQAAWDAAGPNSVANGRNKLIGTQVRVRVTGTYNQIDPNQANAQIVLTSADALEVVAP